jgi:hypothetical protein
VTWMAVKIRTVGGLTRATPENQQETVKQRDPQRPYASHLAQSEMKRWSTPHGDVGIQFQMEETGPSEIPCRVSNERLAPWESDLPSKSG